MFCTQNVTVEIIWLTEGHWNKTAFSLNTALLIFQWVLFCKQWRFNGTNTEYNLSNYFWTFWLIHIFNCKVGPNTKMSWGKTKKVLNCKKVIWVGLQKKESWPKVRKILFHLGKEYKNPSAKTNLGKNFDCSLNRVKVFTFLEKNSQG